MTNCPNCQKPVICEGHFTPITNFNIRCSWCQSDLKISIEPKIIVQLINQEQVSKFIRHPLPVGQITDKAKNIFTAISAVLLIL